MRSAYRLIAAALALSACASGTVSLTHRDISPTYAPGEFGYAAGGRDMWVVIVGNPFGGDAAAFQAAVTDAMQGQHWGQRTNFTTTPGDNANIRYRVVLLFDPPRALNGTRLCREAPSALPSEPADDGVVLFAAFCRGKKLRSQIKGRIAGAAGPDDQAFRDLVGQVTNGLFPLDRGIDRDPGEPLFLIP